jgi:outer membrane protein insertion porin family
LSLFLLNACNITQSLHEGEYLLTNNKLSLEKKIPNSGALKEEALTLIIQKPNKKMFGVIPFRVGIYNLSYNKKENKFRWWLKNKVGEIPVILNNKTTEKSAENIRLFMYNKGFLNAEVTYKSTFDRKKVKVSYSINPGEQFTIQKITLPETKDLLIKHVLETQDKTLLKVNDAFDINILESERKRITDHLRNMGYYEFRKDYVVFELDSNNTNKSINIELIIKGTNCRYLA